MLSLFRVFKITAAATVACILLFASDVFGALNPSAFLMRALNHPYIDEIILYAAMLFPALTFDLVRFKHRRDHQVEVARQRLRVMKATMRTVHDIVGNFLNQLSVFKYQAARSGALDPEALRSLNRLIDETARRLQEISELEGTPEIELSSGQPMIDVSRGRRDSN